MKWRGGGMGAGRRYGPGSQVYGQTLGLTVRSESEDWTEVDADGVSIGLNARESPHSGRGGGAIITFTPDIDLVDEIARHTDAGVQFVGEVAQHSRGNIAAFKDSEGNDLQLFEAPAGG